jgi:hypothetical protein
MPERKIEQLRAFLAQGQGTLSQHARAKEFAALTDTEAERIEALYTHAFGG